MADIIHWWASATTHALLAFRAPNPNHHCPHCSHLQLAPSRLREIEARPGRLVCLASAPAGSYVNAAMRNGSSRPSVALTTTWSLPPSFLRPHRRGLRRTRPTDTPDDTRLRCWRSCPCRCRPSRQSESDGVSRRRRAGCRPRPRPRPRRRC